MPSHPFKFGLKKFLNYNRNHQLFGGRHKRSIQITHEIVHNIMPREINHLLSIFNRIDMLEDQLVKAPQEHSRQKRETVDHIGTVIQV